MESRRGKILIVDDVADAREMYSEYLRFMGYEVDTAENGVIGLEKALDTLPDAVVLDLTMPVLHGLDVLRSLRAYARTSQLFVIVVTGHAMTGTEKEVLAAGADLFLTKPCLPETLEAAIRDRHR